METLNKETKKIERLNAFMEKITEDLSKEEKRDVYETYKETVQDVRPIDLFYVEMYKHHTKQSIQAIKNTANKFVNAFQEGLKRYEMTSHNHPFFKALLDENQAIINHLNQIKAYFKKTPIAAQRDTLIKQFEPLLEIDKKFVKKENILFSAIEENVPSTKPLEVMWSLHDDARKETKKILQLLKDTSVDESILKKTIGHYYYLVYGIIQKERLILFPIADSLLDKPTLDKMYQSCFDIGFVFIERTKEAIKEAKSDFDGSGVFKTTSGILNAKQIALIFNHLPIDITYVDKDDRVQYFNVRKERHFPRNPSIIGRLVKHCHPPKSVDMVEKIVQSFKDGQKDSADFWINFKDKKLYIQYFAIRDENGHYEGVLEASQDITDIQKISGEKRLLDWA